MKTLIKIILVQLCCFPLLITDAMAKDSGRGKDGGNKSNKVSRPSARPTKSSNRNPITQSKASRPAPKPSRPEKRPVANPGKSERPSKKPSLPDKSDRPSTKPARPDKEDRPSNKPARPDKEDRPSTKPALPDKENRPSTKPAFPDKGEKPSTKPSRPDKPERPSTKPNFPAKPGEKPSTKPARPDKKPVRPETKPGNIKYPKPDKPTNRPNKKPEVRPGQNTRPIKKPDFNKPDKRPVGNNKRPNKNNWWESNRKETNINYKNNNYYSNKNYTYKKQVTINNNFKNNVNWSTKRENWGYNPWWNRPATRPWYGGSWNCGWNKKYYHRHNYYHGSYYGGYRPWPGYVVYEDHHNDVAEAIGWGLVGWSLGKLVFDSGYQTYSNPYPAQPVPSSKGSSVTYNQPITVVAAQTAPAEDEEERMTEQSESYIAEAQEAFKQSDYLTALEKSNKAVAEAPGDGALHEFRALVLFSLGKYSEAAGVLNPVLAGGPGWDWSTMITLYNSQQTYLTQLANLETYSRSRPNAADAHFLLGYHYMVCGHLEQANAEFDTAAKLQPADSVSAQLRDLTKASSANGEEDAEEEEETPAESPPPPAAVPLEKLTGTWISEKGDQGTVILAFKDDGKFIWTFSKNDRSNEFGGDYSMNDNGLLVLDAEESQMVASVELPQDSELKFVLAGGPPGDPGLLFSRK